MDLTKEKALIQLQEKRNDKYFEHLQEMQELLNDCEDLKSYYDVRIANINSERSLLRREINDLYNFLIKFGDVGEKITVFDYSFEDFVNIPHFNTLKKNKDISIRHVSFFDYYFYGIMAMIKSAKNKKTLVKETKNFENEQTKWKKETANLMCYKNFLSTAKEIADLYFKTIIVVKELIGYTIIPELEGVETFLYAQAAKDVILSNEEITTLTPVRISRFKNSKKYNDHYIFIKNTHDYYLLITDFFKNPILTNIISKFYESDENSTIFNTLDRDKEKFKKDIEQIENLKQQLIDHTVFSRK